MQRNSPFAIPFGSCNFSTTQTTTHLNFHAKSTTTHSILNCSLHCTTKHYSSLKLLRHIAPVCAPPAQILDFDTPICPTLFLTEVTPACESLGPWWTLAVGNWEDEPLTRTLRLSEMMLPEELSRLAVLEFKTQQFLGIFSHDDEIELSLPAHAVRVLRLTPWDGRSPKILGTDFHITGGACEIGQCTVGPDRIEGVVTPKWQYPMTIIAGFPDDSTVRIARTTVAVEESRFAVS